VTLVSGKHRRLTLIECNNDITSMIDIAKVADLVSDVCVCVLLPGSFREMEIFYFKIENRRDILNTTLLTRRTAHNPSLTMGVNDC